ncbi:hypothetical protein M231_07394 [Tremella mesenterica]|uniref:Uncharacterized protein n=1 Tax=Tremella mesenterica TaxID=5217 RepID=A0A4Q1BFT7_TREME|nr:hypothetical protein M231_07394 [Tremella mesenterica]
MSAVMLIILTPKATSLLKSEHQRLGHIGNDKVKNLGRQGLLKKNWDTYKNDPITTDKCPCGDGKGVGMDVNLTGPFRPAIKQEQYFFVGVERESQIVFAIPITTKNEASDIV